jgi:hypothetical protein
LRSHLRSFATGGCIELGQEGCWAAMCWREPHQRVLESSDRRRQNRPPDTSPTSPRLVRSPRIHARHKIVQPTAVIRRTRQRYSPKSGESTRKTPAKASAVNADDWQASVQASVAAYLDAVTSGQQPPATWIGLLSAITTTARSSCRWTGMPPDQPGSVVPAVGGGGRGARPRGPVPAARSPCGPP